MCGYAGALEDGRKKRAGRSNRDPSCCNQEGGEKGNSEAVQSESHAVGEVSLCAYGTATSKDGAGGQEPVSNHR